MSMKKIKVGDTVRVIAGKEKGREGKVLRIDDKGRLIIEGINMITKHAKPSMANQQGGIIHTEGPVEVSNVMYLYKGQPTRIGFAEKDGKKVRVAKKTGDIID
mgnify:CR=1 FL=1